MNRIRKQPQPQSQRGISVLEMIIVISTITILLAFAFVGVTRARASLRLSGAIREFGAYIEKARVDSIRRHADTMAQGAGVSINNDRASYVVSLDFDGNGTLDTRTIQLPAGISFRTVESIAFDWRGRTWSTVNGVTTSHAQVSISMTNGTTSASADVTGSGDVTIDSRVFDDAVPQVNLKVNSLSSTSGGTSPGGITNTGSDSSGLVNQAATPTPTPTPTSTPTPTPTSTPTPTAVQCTLTAAPGSVTLSVDGTTDVVISHNATTSITITGTSSKPS